MNDRETIHSLLKYSFSRLDIDGYLHGFVRSRRDEVRAVPGDGWDSTALAALEVEQIAGRIRDHLHLASLAVETTALVDTAAMLGNIICRMAKRSAVDVADNRFLDELQKKFEVFHRIFLHYDDGMRKSGSEYGGLYLYALFSIVLHLRFLDAGNFNDLNTSAKLNDVLLKSDRPMSDRAAVTIRAAVELERVYLKGALHG